MAENSLFAILLRSPWWIAAAIALAVSGLAAVVMPEAYKGAALFAGLPFAVIACVAGYRQARMPSARSVDATLRSLRTLPSQDFAALVENALRLQGYDVGRSGAGGADFEAAKEGRVTLVHCRRWKVAQTGIGPLRELASAARAREANEAIYVATGEVTAQARAFAAEHRIRLLDGPALVAWLPAPLRRTVASAR